MLHVLKLVRRHAHGTAFAASPRLLALPALALVIGIVVLVVR
jgi:hypothetical protein